MFLLVFVAEIGHDWICIVNHLLALDEDGEQGLVYLDILQLV
jgi:hypothetical protein